MEGICFKSALIGAAVAIGYATGLLLAFMLGMSL
jgi:hypothetical protein